LATGDLGLKRALNHTDWIGGHKGGTFDALVGRKCGREDYRLQAIQLVMEAISNVRFGPRGDARQETSKAEKFTRFF
jgi:hypothetical protein